MGRADTIGKKTFVDVGSERLRALCDAVGFDASRVDTIERLFRRLIAPRGDRRIGAATGWRSDIGDDGTPFELSLASSDGVPEVRILAEAQGESGTLVAHRDAARAMLRSLEGEFGLSMERFKAIEDLFLPGQPEGRFSLWHSAVVRPGEPVMMKVYLNPKARGEAHADVLVEEALKRLGLGPAWQSVVAARARGAAIDDLKYFSLDLCEGPGARVKIYVHHGRATGRDLEAAAATGRAHVPGAVTAFCRAMTATEGPFPGAPIATCLAWSGESHRPFVTSTYVPFRGHVDNDQRLDTTLVNAWGKPHLVQPEIDVAQPVRPDSGVVAERAHAVADSMTFSMFVMGNRKSTYHDILAQVCEADELGFHGVWLGERHFANGDLLWPSPMVVAAYIAAQTRRIRIGIAARILPFHHPLQVAADALTLDVLSRGRFDLGLSRGSMDESSHVAFGVSRDQARSQFDEQYEILVDASEKAPEFADRIRQRASA